jgi:hypothetical protein
MTRFIERYTGQPSPGATLPLPVSPQNDRQTSSSIPDSLLAALRVMPMSTGQVIGRLGFIDSLVMRKMVDRELQTLGFEKKAEREQGTFAVVKRWFPRAELAR